MSCCPCDTILCCFGCIYCCGCRDILCRKIVFFPPPKLYLFDIEVEPTTPRTLKSGSISTNIIYLNKSPSLASSSPRESVEKLSLVSSDNNGNSTEMRSIIEPEQTMWLVDLEGNKVLPFKSRGFTAYKIKTSNNEVIASYFIKQASAIFTLIISHGNATDIGYTRDNMLDISKALNCNIFAYDYSGYGLSTGLPSISNCHADIDAVYDFLTKRKSIDPKTIIVYGQSLGGGPTSYIAATREVAGVVLHSTFQSALRVIRNEIENTQFYDIFPNIDLVPSIKAPVFIIHGTHDAEINVIHGVKLYENSTKMYEPWFVDGAGHNDIEVNFRSEYLKQLFNFLKFLEKRFKLNVK